MPLNVAAIYGIASNFRARHLSTLQFPGSKTSGAKTPGSAPKQQAAPKASGPQRGGDAHFDQVMSRSAALLDRTAPHRAAAQRVVEDHRSNLDAWHAEHSRAASDLLHTFNSRMNEAQAQTKPSTSGGWAAYNDTFGPHAKPSSPAAPAPSAPSPRRTAIPPSEPTPGRKTMSDFQSAEAAHLDSLRSQRKQTPAVTPTPVKSDAQFRQEDFRPAATSAPREARVYRAPDPKPFTPPAGQIPSGRTPGNPEWDKPTHWSANLPSREQSTPTPAKSVTPRGPRTQKKVTPAPDKPSVSDSEWNSMLSDSVTEHKASKAAAKPASAPATPAGVRETTLKVGGKERVVRTEHNGSQTQLESKHTRAVKSALEEMRSAHNAPRIKEMEQQVAAGKANGAKKSVVAANEKELRAMKRGPSMAPTHSDSFREAYKKTAPIKYSEEVPEHLKPFMGDGPDDPKLSREYGSGK